MDLHRYDYKYEDGTLVKFRSSEVYVWCVVDTETGEVELDDIHRFDDRLFPLDAPYEWRRFTMTLSDKQ